MNAAGYFDAISNDPDQYFGTLSNFPSLIALKSSKDAMEGSRPPPAGSITTARYIGNATIVGQTIINSSSFSLSDPSVVGAYNLYAKGISISSEHKRINYDYKNTSLTNTSALHSQIYPQSKGVNAARSEYIPLKNLKAFGPYQVIINSTGSVSLPSWLSSNDYISISVPPEFNMTLKLLRGASAEFVTTGGLGNNTRHVIINNNYSSSSINTIQFYRINTDSSQVNNIPVLMKSPEIEATGNISFGRLYLDASTYDSQQGIRGSPVQINGKLSAKVDHVDHYDTSRKRTYTKDYLTYFEWLKTDEKTETKMPIQDQLFNLRIPGDISYVAKQASSPIRWQQIAHSNSSILVIISLIIITAIATWLLWPRITKEIGSTRSKTIK